MSGYTTKSGYHLSEEELERLGEACEASNYPGTPGSFVVAPQGRPRLSEEELVTISFKVPRSASEKLDQEAKSQGRTRSQHLRLILEAALS